MDGKALGRKRRLKRGVGPCVTGCRTCELQTPVAQVIHQFLHGLAALDELLLEIEVHHDVTLFQPEDGRVKIVEEALGLQVAASREVVDLLAEIRSQGAESGLDVAQTHSHLASRWQLVDRVAWLPGRCLFFLSRQ